LHYFKDGKWTALLDTSVSASGGTVTDITVDGVDYKVHTFTASGDFSVTATSGGPLSVEFLAVAGGGSGARAGGGAGGVLSSTSALNVGVYPIVVGAGGTRREQHNTRL
jgi:hypothetical protein